MNNRNKELSKEIGLASDTDYLDYLEGQVKKLKQELNNRSQWISVEKFQEVPNEGLCWIVHKGRVKHAYHDHKSMFRFSLWSDNVYMAESITAVQPILTPEPPTQEIDCG